MVLNSVHFVSSDARLRDIVFLDNICVESKVALDFPGEAAALFAKVEALLKEHGMTKHHIIDVKSTFNELAADLVKWNELYDSWMSGVEIVPTQTACQEMPSDLRTPRIAVSITASTAAKIKAARPRAGGGKPEAMIPSEDSAYPAQPMHFPWSGAIGAGDVVWLAGMLDVQVGENMSAQVASLRKALDTTLGELGMERTDIVHSEILVPKKLQSCEFQQLQELYMTEYLENSLSSTCHVNRVEATCAGCKVEITVMASKSRDLKVAVGREGLTALNFAKSCPTLPSIFYRGEVHEGQEAVNILTTQIGTAIAPMHPEEIQQLRALRRDDPELKGASDEQILQLFCSRREDLEGMAHSAMRELSMQVSDISMESCGTSEYHGHPGSYPKVYRLTKENAASFNTDSLARLHVNRRASDGQPVEEFMKVLHGVQKWFFLIDGHVGLLSLPAEWQITYCGICEHGGFMDKDSRAVVCSQIVGPASWEMVYTDTCNSMYDEIKLLVPKAEVLAALNFTNTPARSA